MSTTIEPTRKNADLARAAADWITRRRAAACTELGPLWDDVEFAHRNAKTPARKSEAAAPAMRLCAQCPALSACRVLAEADHYTGLIAGAHYVEGVLRTNLLTNQTTAA